MSQKIDVLHIGTRLSIGGVQSYVINQIKEIDSTKYRLSLAVQRDEIFDYDSIIKEKGGKVFYLPDMNSQPLAYFRELIKLLRENKQISIIHCHMNQNNFIPMIAGRLTSVKVRISHNHSIYVTDSKIKRFIYRFRVGIVNLFSTENVACSTEAGKSMYKNRDFLVLKNSLDTQKYAFDSEKRESLRKALNLENCFTIGHVGNFSQEKNYYFIIDVFHEINKLISTAKLVLVGTGLMEQEVAEYSKSLGLRKSIIFLGVRDDVSDLLSAFDSFIFPSFTEGLGSAAIEAQISGLSVVASNRVPTSAKISSLITFLPLECDAKIWAEELVRLETLNIDRSNISFVEDYNIETNILELEALYDRKY